MSSDLFFSRVMQSRACKQCFLYSILCTWALPRATLHAHWFGFLGSGGGGCIGGEGSGDWIRPRDWPSHIETCDSNNPATMQYGVPNESNILPGFTCSNCPNSYTYTKQKNSIPHFFYGVVWDRTNLVTFSGARERKETKTKLLRFPPPILLLLLLPNLRRMFKDHQPTNETLNRSSV